MGFVGCVNIEVLASTQRPISYDVMREGRCVGRAVKLAYDVGSSCTEQILSVYSNSDSEQDLVRG